MYIFVIVLTYALLLTIYDGITFVKEYLHS